tara:strand:+ start:883 stop:1632 length:750 start_codon:yes stop_codon:yes gene_type:complete
MKLIHKFKSLNFDNRNIKQISYVILHYTALPSIEDSIEYLCHKKNKVSCHYIIGQDGRIYNLVEEKYRAWHAGQSSWMSDHDLNSASIGIELDYSPNHSNNKFSNALMQSLILLLIYLIKKYKIDKRNILGHSDIAPYRKKDPGNKFPWKKLYKKNLSYDPKKVKLSNIKKIRLWFKKYRIYSNKNKILIMLNIIGYDISKSTNSKYFYKILLNNYTNHYFQKISNKNTNITLIDFIELHLYSLLLTKT